jgi:hypothetical protein
MIVWIASYPRSGNSLLRQMLSGVFLLSYTERYRERSISDLTITLPDSHLRDLPMANRVDFTHDYLGPWSEFRAAAAAAHHNVYIKTHEPAGDDCRAIYVVRDPRAALVSYFHFQRRHHPEVPFTQDDVIRGSVSFGSWSAHLQSWQPDRRRATLLVRYEDMIERPGDVIDAIADFLAIPPLRPWKNIFPAYHTAKPDLFGVGSNKERMGELTVAQFALLTDLHGPWMQRLGYRP